MLYAALKDGSDPNVTPVIVREFRKMETARGRILNINYLARRSGASVPSL